MKKIYVDKNNSSAFSTLTDAIKEADRFDESEIVKIIIAPGIYKEKVELKRPFTLIEGSGCENTKITYDDYAFKLHEDGRKYGTFRSYTFFADAHDVTIKNITIENSCKNHKEFGQCIALYAEGEHLYVENCELKSFQDTLFTGPLPPKEMSPGGFIGPKEFSARINGRQYYKNTKIYGDVDFIFGSATAFFEDCDIISDTKDLPAEITEETTLGYVTASSTAEGDEYGYVFKDCRLLSSLPKHTIYLGRPWRNFAKTVYINCYLGEHIKPQGFDDWKKEEAHETIEYAEFGCYGPGALGQRAAFEKILNEKEAARFDKSNVLGDLSKWTCMNL